MEWRTQGLCPTCGQRLPVRKRGGGGRRFEEHQKCYKDSFVCRKAPAAPFNRLYPIACVSRLLGGNKAHLYGLVNCSNIEHKILRIGSREIVCITFEEILRRSADCISKPAWKGYGIFIATSRNRVFRLLEDVERLCFLDSTKFRLIWTHQEKEKS